MMMAALRAQLRAKSLALLQLEKKPWTIICLSRGFLLIEAWRSCKSGCTLQVASLTVPFPGTVLVSTGSYFSWRAEGP